MENKVVPRGTKVICTKHLPGQFTVGSIYELRDGFGGNHDYVRVVMDDAGKRNGWGHQNFELIEESAIPIKLEVGKSYRTRDGKRATITNRYGYRPAVYGTVENDTNYSGATRDWNLDGTRDKNNGNPELEIVGPWVEGYAGPKTPSRKRAEELIKIVNERLEALMELNKDYQGISERSFDGKNFCSMGSIENSFRFYRLKPETSKFPDPIVLTHSGHKIAIHILDAAPDNCEINVGCQRFNVGALKNALKSINSGHCSRHVYFENDIKKEFRVTRTGVAYENYILTWADADQLLGFLERASRENK